MTDIASRQASRGRHPSRHRGPTTAPPPGGPARWPERPWLARVIRLAVFVVPIVLSFVVAIVVTRMIGTPDAFELRVLRWLLIAVIATVAMLVAQRLMRNLLPLAALLSLTLVFPDETPSRFGIALRGMSARQLKRKLADVEDTGLGDTPDAAATSVLELVALLSRHDRMTRGHSERVRAYSVMIGEELGLGPEDIDRLRWAALLHDVGKLHVPYEILNKPEGLTYDEFEMVKQHTVAGKAMVAPLADWLGPAAGAVYEHHERWAGGGYPTGVPSEQLALASRIISVADAFDVMTSARSYKSQVSARAARVELQRCAGSQFDPMVVRAMMNISLGQLWRTMGPLSWVGQIGLFPRPVAQGGTAATAVAALLLSLLLAGLASATTAGRNEAADPLLVTTSTEVHNDAAASPPPTSSPPGVAVAAGDAGAGGPASASASSTTIAPASGSDATSSSTTVEPEAALTQPDLETLGPVPIGPAATITTTPAATATAATATTIAPVRATTTTIATRIVTSTTVTRSTTASTVAPTTVPTIVVATTAAPTVATTVAPTTVAPPAPVTTVPVTPVPVTTVPVTPVPVTTVAPPTTTTTVAATTTTTVPVTTTTTTTTVPVTVPPNEFVLASPGVGDQVHQPILDLEPTRPVLNQTLPNFDTDRNTDPGLTMVPMQGNIQSDDPSDIQVWRFPSTTASVDGAVLLELWVASAEAPGPGQLQMRAALFDCDIARTSCDVLVRDTSATIDGDAGEFMQFDFDLTIGPDPYVVAPGRRLELRVATRNGSKNDAWIGYDSVETPSRLVIEPPIAAAGLTSLATGSQSPMHGPLTLIAMLMLAGTAYAARREHHAGAGAPELIIRR